MVDIWVRPQYNSIGDALEEGVESGRALNEGRIKRRRNEAYGNAYQTGGYDAVEREAARMGDMEGVASAQDRGNTQDVRGHERRARALQWFQVNAPIALRVLAVAKREQDPQRRGALLQQHRQRFVEMGLDEALVDQKIQALTNPETAEQTFAEIEGGFNQYQQPDWDIETVLNQQGQPERRAVATGPSGEIMQGPNAIAAEPPEWQDSGTTPFRIVNGRVELGEGEIPHRPREGRAPRDVHPMTDDEAAQWGVENPEDYMVNEGVPQPLRTPRAPYTQDQTLAAGYATRMQEAHDIMTRMENAHRNDRQFWNDVWTVGAVGAGGPDVQQYRQAVRNFQNAQLRRESGAVISPTEFGSARQQYTPNPIDDPTTMDQKRQTREQSLDAMVFASQGAFEDLRGRRQAGTGGARARGAPSAARGAQGGPRQIQTEAEYQALPRGAEYIGPDGQRRRKQ